MRINFFEEYPIEDNLAKARLIDFPSTVFLAGHSLQEFYELKEKLLNINPNLEVAYWPILLRTYWFSPFSYTKDLQSFFKEMKTNSEPLTILVDLELPLKNKFFLYFVNLFSFFKNKKIIKEFFKNAPNSKINIVAAEYPFFNLFMLRFFRILGISYDTKIYGHRACVMYYTSMIPNRMLKKVTNAIIKTKNKFNPNLELGLGAIDVGVWGNEPKLFPDKLAQDLSFMQKNGFETAIIFRLGGFNEEYYKVIKPFI